MTTPTKQPILSQGILTPSCDITPTRETARDEYGFASLTQNGSEAPRDGTAPSEAPAVSVEPAYDGAEPSPSSPFTYDGDGDRAEPAAGGSDSFDPFPGIPAPTKPEEVHEAAAVEPETADDDAPATRALSRPPAPPSGARASRPWASACFAGRSYIISTTTASRSRCPRAPSIMSNRRSCT